MPVGPENPLEEHRVTPITYREKVEVLSEAEAEKLLTDARAAVDDAFKMRQFKEGLGAVIEVVKPLLSAAAL